MIFRSCQPPTYSLKENKSFTGMFTKSQPRYGCFLMSSYYELK